jgi:hypothetical protein
LNLIHSAGDPLVHQRDTSVDVVRGRRRASGSNGLATSWRWQCHRRSMLRI